MKVATIAWRELAERRLAWAAAALAGVAATALPLLSGPLDLKVAENLPIAMLALQFTFALALAAVLGVAMIPADLANRRLGFYLARPVGGGEILLGRFLGAWILAVTSGILVALPHVLLHPSQALVAAQVAGLTALLAIPVLCGAHLAGVLWFARSPWLLLDALAATAFLRLLGALLQHLVQAGAWDGLGRFVLGTTVLVSLLLAAATWVQMALGRADLRRSHRLVSLTMAAGLLGILTLGGLYGLWLTSGGPTSLRSFQVEAVAPQGDWLLLSGQGRAQRRSFLVNARTGESLPAPGPGWFSGDGRRFVSLDPDREPLAIRVAELGAQPARVVAGRAPVPVPPGERVTLKGLSPNGRYAVLLQGLRHWLLADLQTGRTVFLGSGPRSFPASRYLFLDEHQLRAYEPGPDGIRIRQLQVDTGAWTELGHLSSGEPVSVEPSGQRALLQTAGVYHLCDGVTGARLAQVAPTPGARFAGMPLWAGQGTLAFLECQGQAASLRVLDPAGQPLWTQPLPSPMVEMAAEPGGARIFLNLLDRPRGSGPLTGRLGVADPLRRTWTVAAGNRLLALPQSPGQRAGALATRLQVGAEGGLSFADPTGASRTLLRTARYAGGLE